MTRRWREPEFVSVPRALLAATGGHPLVAETLVRRGKQTVTEAQAFLDATAYQPAEPESMPGMADAVTRIQQALDGHERILVWGDFDVDGQTSTTLLVSCFQDLGGDVVYHIPVRDTESHGMKVPWLAQELAQDIDLVVTCDTGIDAHEAVAYARSRGVDVVITDHHELTTTLPDAVAVVNPHRLPEDHPLASLPGVGVAYKLAEALYARAARPELATALLDLVALGIVADVAVQTDDTRYLLQRGLQVLRETSRLGLQELMSRAKVTPVALTEDDIGFGLGPRLNAVGRLDDANVIVEFLTTQDLARARILASQLESLNAKRRLLCDQVHAAAEAKLERDPKLLESAALVMGDPQWPAGVIGVVANRLVGRYERPVILLTMPSGEDARGSARSVEGCHITQAIATQQEMLSAFGGHAMAAGLSIEPGRIDAFRRGVSKAVEGQLAEKAVEQLFQIDGYVGLGELSEELVSDLRRLAPFGRGNPPLVLATRDVKVVRHRTLGHARRHARVTVEDSGETRRDVVWWNWDEALLPQGAFDLAFTLGLNHFRGKTNVQLVWQATRVPQDAGGAPVPQGAPAAALEIIDFRSRRDFPGLLREETGRVASVSVWAEGLGWEDGIGQPRHQLQLAETLVVWSRPPSVDVLHLALRRTSAERVVLMGDNRGLDGKKAFLGFLLRFVKTILRARDGVASVPKLAALTGHREHTVRVGIQWLAAKGLCALVKDRGEAMELAPVEKAEPDSAALAAADAALSQVLEDTAAYRRHFARADVARLLALA